MAKVKTCTISKVIGKGEVLNCNNLAMYHFQNEHICESCKKDMIQTMKSLNLKGNLKDTDWSKELTDLFQKE